MSEFPLNYLTGYGSGASAIAPLTRGLIAVSLGIIIIISALILFAIFRRRPIEQADRIVQTNTPLSWIYAGAGLTVAVLVGLLVWTLTTMAAVNRSNRAPALDLEVTARQWWWEIRYLDKDAFRIFTTANEIHIPVGEAVRIRLRGGDVIHSFWAPALNGKTDMIPGQINVTWLRADRPGVYRGQCAEYCGKQHGHMAFTVVAESRDSFDAWRAGQVKGKTPLASEPAAIGRKAFQSHCSVCHTVRGSLAGGAVGPDLTHLMSRATIAAGALPNTPGALAGWIADPQHIKPGAKMPRLDMSGAQLHAVTTYLATLN
ncbi:cytochrome c oxidase subunit II [Methylocella tundrae]|uniref:Cytochrome aa3 subunit 2 n=1 Tax=Methylocella tundrae TaxID=227605 RepID=A0A4U8Z6P7_METTU|nr:cytochrome c oxidase subunit II [Methylocella tundrae]WPP02862.1 cytochrome c oxidase subunit II [Methylocella tundrae]VFU16476.1 Cytochrome c oxidase, subunit II [Methylocella tundrae]